MTSRLCRIISTKAAGRHFAIIALMVFPWVARAQFSAFTAGTEGWTIVSVPDLSAPNFFSPNFYSATFTASGGNPGGYISSMDPDGGDFTFAAPSLFLGNHTADYGSSLRYDFYYGSTVNYNTTDVVLTGGGVTLLWQKNPTFIPGASWTTVTATLTPSSQWHVVSTSGALATAGDFATVLANLTGFYIRGEYAFGADDARLDNVQFGLVPEPTVLALLAASLAPVGWWVRREHRRRKLA